MNLGAFKAGVNWDNAGVSMYTAAADLYPLCRSITGDGLRETLRRIGEFIPLQITEIPTGTRVLDWEIPREWTIRDAYIVAPDGNRLAEFRSHNLHVLNYSAPMHARMPLEDLKRHLHTLPGHADWIPYRTSYYQDDWGFCMPYRQAETLPGGEYEVVIDSELKEGSLTYGECVLPGAIPDEVLISAHVCHPSLANDNLSGVVVAAQLAAMLQACPRRHTFRFVFAPGTIGAIAWLARNEDHVKQIRHGMVLACLGDSAPKTYKRSRRHNAFVDQAAAHVLSQSGEACQILDFTPCGYDERQYGSPGFDLPVGCFMRSMPGAFPEYHTSADNLDFIKPEALADSLRTLLDIVEIIECDGVYRNTHPKGEPQLGRRGIYRTLGGMTTRQTAELALLWALNYSDGRHSLLDIASKAGMPFAALREAADLLEKHSLLERIPVVTD